MGKTSKWIKSLLTGKKEKKEKEKEKEKEDKEKGNQPSPLPTENPTTPIAIPTPKDKRRWSFRRSPAPATPNDSNSLEPIASTPIRGMSEPEKEQMKHAMAVAAATAAAADAAVAAAQAAVAAVRLTTATTVRPGAVEEAAAIKIQAIFRSYLARKALCALKGLVKLQALVRGHLVRRQATATLRCMHALLAVQARARAQRIRISDEEYLISQRHSVHRKSPQDNRYRRSYEIDRSVEENIKIVEMDLGETRDNSKSRNSYSNPHTERADHRLVTPHAGNCAHSKLDNQLNMSPTPLALTETSPRVCSGHFEDYSFTTAQSSPQYSSAVSKPDPTRTPFTLPRTEFSDPMSHDYPFFPNYMANTESSKAKVRSQSAPKQRPDSYERPPSRRRSSMEGRNIPRGVRMQRSSSHVGSTANGYHPDPWSVKLDRSTVSLKDSECGSTSTVLTNNTYCRSLVTYEGHGIRY